MLQAAWAAISGAGVAAAGAEGAAIAGGISVPAAAPAVAGAGSGASVASLVSGSVLEAASGALLSAALAPKIPGQKPPTSLPNQSAIEEAKKRSVLLQRQRAGRQSTILSQGDGGTLG